MKIINFLILFTPFLFIACNGGKDDKAPAKTELEQQLEAELEQLKKEREQEEKKFEELTLKMQDFEEEKAAREAEEKAAKEQEQEQKDAKDFALSVVKTYFLSDCDTLMNAFPNPKIIYIDEKGNLIEKENELENLAEMIAVFKEKDLCRDAFKKLGRELRFSFADYLEKAEIKILNSNAILKKYPQLKEAETLKITEKDYLFKGYKGVTDDEVSIIFSFLVRKDPEKEWIVVTLFTDVLELKEARPALKRRAQPVKKAVEEVQPVEEPIEEAQPVKVE